MFKPSFHRSFAGNLKKFHSFSLARSVYQQPSFDINDSNSSDLKNDKKIVEIRRKTISDIYNIYHKKEPITVLTAHDFITGKFADLAKTDIVLVGDSLGMVSLGYPSTNELPFEEFLYHVKSVSRGVRQSFLIADLPFGTYETSIEKAVESSIQLVKNGANAVKLEGGVEYLDTIKKLSSIGIPVVGHIGLTPQRHNSLGGFKAQGKNVNNALEIFKNALCLQKTGAKLLLLECIPQKLAKYITENVSIPTIGIGAGNHTSAQVIVQSDLLGMHGVNSLPKFVKPYENFLEKGVSAIKKYNHDVKTRAYPETGIHTFTIKNSVYLDFLEIAEKIKTYPLKDLQSFDLDVN
ncbi:3-methyl-2-oxobutanoate hydroxymethyltransferase ASCRUDRAFT_9850 [Ascoidea rubescens DSM 1968]|uniref:3-methyl-2-oxobutanoate hydroxymethyltransferase n=1 Tax=Ascoidea rubescens DSM 1968 TaxID=1344418 RepID=A0A1D2VCB0_9ASCO|nr:hypothetical protein ASCRUDRAFT_9850 [Ascoidea rubescens DSM 1968]ODV59113.1 hypothetical protein ASCRUDRAFT_9850 [Ascoidea rubescens DSM 1968]